MKKIAFLLQLALSAALLSMFQAKASEADDVKIVVQSLYKENEKALLCHTQEEGVDPTLIKVPEKYFSRKFIAHFRPACLAETNFIVAFDIRTGDSDIFVLSGYRPEILNLKIGKPSIHGPAADVKVTYGLEKAPLETFGNFSKYKLVKEDGKWKIDDIELGGTGRDRTSMTGMPAIPSMVRYIDENLAKERRKKK